MAQRIRHLTTDQGIPGSNPGRVVFFFFFLVFFFLLFFSPSLFFPLHTLNFTTFSSLYIFFSSQLASQIFFWK